LILLRAGFRVNEVYMYMGTSIAVFRVLSHVAGLYLCKGELCVPSLRCSAGCFIKQGRKP
jgi:hypothetical protein